MPSEQHRADVKAARDAWFEAQPDLEPERPIFIDETGLNTKMARLRGRCRRGERLRMAVPHGHWRTTTFVAELRVGGLDAPMLIDGAMNGQAFNACFRRVLVPALRPGDVVIMDNLGCHKSAAVRAAITAAGAELRLLPPYSPDLNQSSPSPAESAPSKGRRADKGRPLECRDRGIGRIQPHRVREHVHSHRIRAGLIGKCSNGPPQKIRKRAKPTHMQKPRTTAMIIAKK